MTETNWAEIARQKNQECQVFLIAARMHWEQLDASLQQTEASLKEMRVLLEGARDGLRDISKTD